MTEVEVQSWLASLGRSPEGQLAAIEDLLRNAVGDKMSAEDRAICRTEAGKLRQQIRETRAAGKIYQQLLSEQPQAAQEA